MSRRALRVPGVAPPQAHYSHGIVSEGIMAPHCHLLWVAGQVPVAPDGAVVEGDAAAQARQVLENLSAVLAAAGGSLDDIVKTTTFLVDLSDRRPVGEVRRERFSDPAPANSLLVVSSLADPSYRVEIEAVAVIPTASKSNT